MPAALRLLAWHKRIGVESPNENKISDVYRRRAWSEVEWVSQGKVERTMGRRSLHVWLDDFSNVVHRHPFSSGMYLGRPYIEAARSVCVAPPDGFQPLLMTRTR